MSVNLEHLNTGLYLVKMINGVGQVLQVKKIVKR